MRSTWVRAGLNIGMFLRVPTYGGSLYDRRKKSTQFVLDVFDHYNVPYGPDVVGLQSPCGAALGHETFL